ncbi:hypothetical protein TanjilG_10014 [Lupinus angustifolius]|uniref:Uncharacterized protein n=1 Tax=Lupinus angustifolius TaxID=3871 RepID=A0A1J7GKC0_LUPAN|nr:PREDICTED: uncharacterized protein DDB_G0281497-like [Lupinus angustifolius]OIW00936.1 hypothetical protein TanjilG_10014 [Lupinus angustifolius]
MAYRRRQGMLRTSTFKEEIHNNNNNNNNLDENGTINNNDLLNSHNHSTLSSSFSFTPTSSSSSSSSSSLAAQAIKASASRHDPSLSFSFSTPSDHQRSKSFDTYGEVLGKGDPKNGFWGVLAQKAKEILEDEISSPPQNDIVLDKLKSYSFKTFTPNVLPLDGRTSVENKNEMEVKEDQGWQQQQQAKSQTIHETQLKASRDVAMATAAKAKLLLRELKTVKADLAFAKARSAQLEEENKLLRDREGREKGQNRADDDLIRLQLETLLGEKARLANENETYSRENRFLREIVEYHQLTMQDVVYLDEGTEEVTELYPIHDARIMSMSTTRSSSPLGNGKYIFPIPQEVDENEDYNYKNTRSEDEAPPICDDNHAK